LLLFRRKNLLAAKACYDGHRGKTIVLARLIPFIRTFPRPHRRRRPVEMPSRSFVTWNVAGGLLWSVGLTLAGYFLGETIPGIDRHILVIVTAAILISVLPSLIHMWRKYRHEACAFVQRRLGRTPVCNPGEDPPGP
jgi:membrane-associated protein